MGILQWSQGRKICGLEVQETCLQHKDSEVILSKILVVGAGKKSPSSTTKYFKLQQYPNRNKIYSQLTIVHQDNYISFLDNSKRDILQQIYSL